MLSLIVIPTYFDLYEIADEKGRRKKKVSSRIRKNNLWRQYVSVGVSLFFKKRRELDSYNLLIISEMLNFASSFVLDFFNIVICEQDTLNSN